MLALLVIAPSIAVAQVDDEESNFRAYTCADDAHSDPYIQIVLAEPIRNAAELKRDSPDDETPEELLNFLETGRSVGAVVIDGTLHLATGDQAALDYRIDFIDDPNNPGKYALVVSHDGSAIFYDFQGKETAKGDRMLYCERLSADEAEKLLAEFEGGSDKN